MRPQPDSLSVYKMLLDVNRSLLAVDGYRNLATAENREPLELQPIHRHTGHNIASYVLGTVLPCRYSIRRHRLFLRHREHRYR